MPERPFALVTGASRGIGATVARMLADTEQEATPLQKEIDVVGKTLGIAVIVIAGWLVSRRRDVS